MMRLRITDVKEGGLLHSLLLLSNADNWCAPPRSERTQLDHKNNNNDNDNDDNNDNKSFKSDDNINEQKSPNINDNNNDNNRDDDDDSKNGVNAENPHTAFRHWSYIVEANDICNNRLYRSRSDVITGEMTDDEIIKAKQKLVYLSADSDNVLEELEEDKIYVIGGLLDHNRLKGLSHQRAVDSAIPTAALPISNFIQVSGRHVLTINQGLILLNRVFN